MFTWLSQCLLAWFVGCWLVGWLVGLACRAITQQIKKGKLLRASFFLLLLYLFFTGLSTGQVGFISFVQTRHKTRNCERAKKEEEEGTFLTNFLFGNHVQFTSLRQRVEKEKIWVRSTSRAFFSFSSLSLSYFFSPLSYFLLSLFPTFSLFFSLFLSSSLFFSLPHILSFFLFSSLFSSSRRSRSGCVHCARFTDQIVNRKYLLSLFSAESPSSSTYLLRTTYIDTYDDFLWKVTQRQQQLFVLFLSHSLSFPFSLFQFFFLFLFFPFLSLCVF